MVTRLFLTATLLLCLLGTTRASVRGSSADGDAEQMDDEVAENHFTDEEVQAVADTILASGALRDLDDHNNEAEQEHLEGGDGEINEETKKKFLDEYFLTLDHDEDGTVDLEELDLHFLALQSIRDQQREGLTDYITQTFTDVDADGDGLLDHLEFEKIFLDEGGRGNKESNFTQAEKAESMEHFEHADLDKSGSVDMNEVLSYAHLDANVDAEEDFPHQLGEAVSSSIKESAKDLGLSEEELEALAPHERVIMKHEAQLARDADIAIDLHGDHDADGDGKLSKEEFLAEHTVWYDVISLLFPTTNYDYGAEGAEL